MRLTFDKLFPSYPTWNSPHHMDRLEPFSVKFSFYDRRATNYLGLCYMSYPAINLLSSINSWDEWESVSILTQVNLEEPHSYGFKNKTTGAHLFVYFHEELGKQVADLYYVDGKNKAAIKKFIEMGFYNIKHCH